MNKHKYPGRFDRHHTITESTFATKMPRSRSLDDQIERSSIATHASEEELNAIHEQLYSGARFVTIFEVPTLYDHDSVLVRAKSISGQSRNPLKLRRALRDALKGTQLTLKWSVWSAARSSYVSWIGRHSISQHDRRLLPPPQGTH